MNNKRLENIVKHAELSEKSIERYLVDLVSRLGGICLKYSNPNMVGYPDRVVLLPGGVTIWIELKSAGRHVTKIQQIRIADMAAMGHKIFIADSKEDINEIIRNAGYAI